MQSCPFCGSEGQVETDGNLYWVACQECSAYGPVTLAPALAVKLWDKRVTGTPPGSTAKASGSGAATPPPADPPPAGT